MTRSLTLVFVAAATLRAQDGKPPMGQIKLVDGAWERLQQGGAEATPELRVNSQMRVLIKSDSRSGRITYRFIQAVHVRSARAAEALLTGDASINSSGASTVISAHGAGSFSTLEVYVPLTVKTVSADVSRGGDIEAYGLRGSLHARTFAGDITTENIGGDVLAFTGGGHIQIGQTGGNVTCSTGAGSVTVASANNVNCETAGGEVVVKQSAGAVNVSSGGGNIQVEQASRNVEAHSVRGEISVGRAGGLVAATTGGGAIRIGSAAGVHVASANGPVYLMGATGALSVSTALGSILARLVAGGRLQNSSLVAGSGDITVMIPPTVALSVMATNDRGGIPHIDSEYPGFSVALLNGAPILNFGRPPLAKGDINGGGPTLVLSGSDMIYLRRTR